MKPLVRSYTTKPAAASLVDAWMDHFKCDRQEALTLIEEYNAKSEIWINDVYQVQKTPAGNGLVQLNIRRRDGKPIFRDWRDFQEIKNQLVGPECEGIELYPAESRLVDTANKYHLFVCTDPTFRFPMGWSARDVSYQPTDVPGLKQRPFK
jgi:hypothetical protein